MRSSFRARRFVRPSVSLNYSEPAPLATPAGEGGGSLPAVAILPVRSRREEGPRAGLLFRPAFRLLTKTGRESSGFVRGRCRREGRSLPSRAKVRSGLGRRRLA